MSKPDENRKKLDVYLRKVGDLYFRRCIETINKFGEFQKSDLVLDAGCGDGFIDLVINDLYGCKISAIDHDEKILNLARSRVGKVPGVTFSQMDICNLDFNDDTFDKVICSEVIEHVKNDSKALSELYRVLKPGGTLVLTVPNKNYPLFWDPINKIREGLGLGHFSAYNRFLGGMWSLGHLRLYKKEGLLSLLENHGFEAKHISMMTHYSIPFNLLVLNIGKVASTLLPVGKGVKSAMEKFDVEEPTLSKRHASISDRIMQFFLGILLKIDKLNDKNFDKETSTVGIGVCAIKK